MKTPDVKYFGQAIHAVLADFTVRSATLFLGGGQRVTVTRLFRVDKRSTREMLRETLLVTYGGFNFEQRELIAKRRRRGFTYPECPGLFDLKRWPKPVKAKAKARKK